MPDASHATNRRREWIATPSAVVAAFLFAAVAGQYISPAISLFGFVIVLFATHTLLNPRSRTDARLAVSALVGVTVMIGAITGFDITPNDLLPAVMVVLATAIVVLCVERALSLTRHFRGPESLVRPGREILAELGSTQTQPGDWYLVIRSGRHRPV